MQKEVFPLPFLEFRYFFRSFRNFVIKFYMNIFLVIVMILICRMLRLSIIIPFDILKFSSNEKLEKEKLNNKKLLFKKFLKLHLCFFSYEKSLWENSVSNLKYWLEFVSLFRLRFCKN